MTRIDLDLPNEKTYIPPNPEVEYEDEELSVPYFIHYIAHFFNGPLGILATVAINILPILMIVIGIMNLENCPIEPRIPLWLIGVGLIFIIYTVTRCFHYLVTFGRENEQTLAYNFHKNPINHLVVLITIICLAIGIYWIYGVYEAVSYEMFSSDYCEMFTYRLSLFAVTFTSVMLILCVVICLSVWAVAAAGEMFSRLD